MIYRQIVGDVSVEYEGTPEEIKAMLDAECNHTGAYDHAALNTGNGVEMVCLRCKEAKSEEQFVGLVPYGMTYQDFTGLSNETLETYFKNLAKHFSK